jgi:hypothetical protein
MPRSYKCFLPFRFTDQTVYAFLASIAHARWPPHRTSHNEELRNVCRQLRIVDRVEGIDAMGQQRNETAHIKCARKLTETPRKGEDNIGMDFK